MDILDVLEAAPEVQAACAIREEMKEYERRRKAWLKSYKPDLKRCREEED